MSYIMTFMLGNLSGFILMCILFVGGKDEKN